MPKPANQGTGDSGQLNVTETVSEEEKAATKALEDDSTTWDDGEEVESRFEAEEEDDSAATDEDDSDAEELDDAVESEEDDSDDAESEDSEENDQDAEEDSDAADDATATDIEAERKKHNDEMAKARIAERKAQAEAESLRQEKQEQSIQDYLDEAGDDANDRARRENNVEQFRLQEERVALNHDKLQGGIERALTTVDLFRTGSPAAKEELLAAVDDFESKYVEFDKNNRPLRIKIDPATGKQADVVTYLQRKADSIKRIQGDGATQQVKRKKSEKSRTLQTPKRVPKTPKTDPDLDGFDEEARK